MAVAPRPELIYEVSPRYATAAIAAVIGLLILFDLVFGLILPEVMWLMAITALSELVLFYIIIPRKYQILSDRLRIRLGGPVKVDIPFFTIREARPARAADAFVYWGLRLATSTEGVVEIIRRGGGLDMVISPRDRETFLKKLDLALAATDRDAPPPRV